MIESGASSAELALLGAVLTDNAVWPQTEPLSRGEFLLSAHQTIFARMAAMREEGLSIDGNSLRTELDRNGELEKIGGHAYIGALIDHGVPTHVNTYVRQIKDLAVLRGVERLRDTIGSTLAGRQPDTLDKLRAHVTELQTLLTRDSGRLNWRSLFHDFEQIQNAPPTRFAIGDFLQEDGITVIGGLPGHGKTLFMLAMVRALLEGEGQKLFCHFRVNRTAERVIYLIHEAGLTPFATRLKTFRLMDHVRAGRLFSRTLSMPGDLSLDDPLLLEAVKGADVFLDTCIRFLDGDENSAADQKKFAETLFALQRAGARTIIGAHHSPKAFGNASSMTLENVLRGSGDVGAMLVTAWGISQVDAASNQIYVQNVKPRDFQPCEPFVIQGRPSLDQTGYFELIAPPGFAEDFSKYREKKSG
jgi:hypothetical protein